MQSATLFERKNMSQNLTQPEEIDHVLMEMAGHDMKVGAPDLSSGFVGAVPANEKPEFNRNCNQSGESS